MKISKIALLNKMLKTTKKNQKYVIKSMTNNSIFVHALGNSDCNTFFANCCGCCPSCGCSTKSTLTASGSCTGTLTSDGLNGWSGQINCGGTCSPYICIKCNNGTTGTCTDYSEAIQCLPCGTGTPLGCAHGAEWSCNCTAQSFTYQCDALSGGCGCFDVAVSITFS